MSNARNLARLIVDSGGDVDVSSLGNVPPSNDASALTTGTLPIARIADGAVSTAKLAADAVPIGVGQTWQDVTGSRAVGTTYTNSTGKPIMFVITGARTGGSSSTMAVYIDGVSVAAVSVAESAYTSWYTLQNTATFIVPQGSSYSITFSGTAGVNKWFELR